MRPLFALSALLFALPAHAVTIDWVTVADPENAADTEVMTCCGSSTGTSGYGSVAYEYLVGKYEVTNAQYAEFLNAVADTDTYGLYNLSMGLIPSHGGITRTVGPGGYTYTASGGRENMPVNYVSFYDALRFANWLHNGQPTGAQDSTTTEDGAYTFSGATSVGSRNAGATVFLTSEDEWYKAAYYDGASYFDYPAGTDTQSTCALPGATANRANCWPGLLDLADVGSYTGSVSPNGTFDQGGNVSEWNEAIIGSDRGLRGGGFGDTAGYLAAGYRIPTDPSSENEDIGFRVSSVPTGWFTDCNDGIDNDADGSIDWSGGPLGEPADPGCANTSDGSEKDDNLPCDDGADNDGDGSIDFDPVTFADPGDQFTLPAGSGDPGCIDPSWFIEDSQCQDGIDNDGDGRVDYDGGLAALGYVAAEPDPHCAGRPWGIIEGLPTCGLGVELALLLPPLMWFWRRRA